MPDDRSRPSVEALFAGWLARREAGEAVDFEALCREHADRAPELRELHQHWTRLLPVLRAQGGDASTGGSLAEYGSGVDLRVTLTLGGEAAAQDTSSSEVVARLAGRGPASTRYRIQGEIAHGGMGAVLSVWDEDLRRQLAMKVMLEKSAPDEGGGGRPKGKTPADPKQLARFLEEAQVTAQLDHPGIAPVHELGLDAERRVYFTMKLVKGRTLKDVFHELARGEGGWTQARVLSLLLKVCEAMSYAHAKGVIHRDLKPANIMVGRFGEVFVMDWGLARILGHDDARDLRIRPEAPIVASQVESDRRQGAGETPDSPLYTMDGDVVGTPAYMPPEQAAGKLAEMGPHSDVYALGAMLYHLIAGHMPYVPPGTRLNNYAVWQRVQDGPPRPLHELAPAAPAELVAICERAMAREIGARYADTSELAEDLSAYVEGRVVRAYETGAWAEAKKWVRRNKPLAASLGAAVLLALVGAGAVAYVQAKGKTAAEGQRRIAQANEKRALAGEKLAEDNARLAKANETAAKEQAARADAQERVATQRADDVLSLSASKDLEDLVARAETLWPVHPDLIDDYERWLADARELLEGRPAEPARGLKKRPSLEEHRAKLAELRLRAIPLTEEQGQAAVNERRTWDFEDPEDRWWHVQLSKLVSDLEELANPLRGVMGDNLVEPHGWGVGKRYEFARTIAERSVEGAEAARRWDEARDAIGTSPRYGGLELVPQVGLLPIGADPESGLWEFAHLQTGAPAERGPDGKLLLTEETGLVFVLIPGGTFWMGAQKSDPNGLNHDPDAARDESPVHEVELSAYFLSKYEMTQGQWERMGVRNPSYYGPSTNVSGHQHDLRHPVEQVTWLDCMGIMERLGLSLPSEAQWEMGCRGGTSSAWWTGKERESLRGRVNLADQSAKRAGATWSDINDWPDLEDGWVAHAPVGSLPPNGFGLHEVHGNVWEWCLDGYDGGAYGKPRGKDPVPPWEDFADRVYHGGSFNSSASIARSAYRGNRAPENRGSSLGLRPARAITP